MPGPADRRKSPSTPFDTDGGISTTYTYDQQARLVAVCEPGAGATTTFTYPDA
ncbi:MAG TPA: hypothetical protein VFI31_04385 [Pirellulales bacterium]|nr:hypothetical protein [Pirellulales bacterium]